MSGFGKMDFAGTSGVEPRRSVDYVLCIAIAAVQGFFCVGLNNKIFNSGLSGLRKRKEQVIENENYFKGRQCKRICGRSQRV